MNKVINNYRCGLLIMVALVFLSISCYGQTNNRKDHELRGPVCAVVVKDIKFSIRFGEVEPTGESNDTLYYFLKNGNVYMEKYASNNYSRFEYDGHNNLTEKICVSVGMGEEYWIGDNLYHLNDTTGRKLYQYVYDSEDRLKEIKCFREQLNDMEQYYMEQYYRIVYSYNSSGKKIVYRNESSIDKEEIYNGSVRKEIKYYFGSSRITTETLNAKGKPTKREIIHKPYFENSIFSYNKYGDEVKILRQLGNVSHEVETTQYVYDQNGNWIKKLHYVNNKLKTWTEREITYATSVDDYSKVIEEAMKLEAIGLKINDMVKHEQDSIQALQDSIQALQDSIQALQDSIQKAWEEEEEVAKGGPITDDVDEVAHFPGGEAALIRFVSQNTKYPEIALENGVQGIVLVRFIIECDGSILFLRVEESPSEELSKAAIRVVKSMPKWKPAMKDGHPVRSSFRIPISFRI